MAEVPERIVQQLQRQFEEIQAQLRAQEVMRNRTRPSPINEVFQPMAPIGRVNGPRVDAKSALINMVQQN